MVPDEKRDLSLDNMIPKRLAEVFRNHVEQLIEKFRAVAESAERGSPIKISTSIQFNSTAEAQNAKTLTTFAFGYVNLDKEIEEMVSDNFEDLLA